MQYLKIYNALINRGKLRKLDSEGYYERHHIIPKCMGGIYDSENLVYLTGREHYVAHQLLVKIYPEEPKLVYAACMMTVDNNGGRVNNRRYEWLRMSFSKASSSVQKGKKQNWDEETRLRVNIATKIRMNKPEEKLRVSLLFTGKKPTEETRLKMSDSAKIRMNKPEEKLRVSLQSTGRKHTEESKLKIGLSSKSRTRSQEAIEKQKLSNRGFKHSENTLKVLSENKLGVKNPMFGKKHSEETKNKRRITLEKNGKWKKKIDVRINDV